MGTELRADGGMLRWPALLCGFLAVFVFRRNLSSEYAFFLSAPFAAVPRGEEANIVKWFALFRDRPLVAFISFDFFDAVNALLVAILLWPHLRVRSRTHRVLGASLLVADFLSPVLFFWSNRSAELYRLSRQYFRSHHFEEKLPYLDAGRDVLRQMVDPGSTPNRLNAAALALFLLTGLSIALLNLGAHRKHLLGVIGNALALAYFPLIAFAPRFAFIPTALSAPFLLAWYFLLAMGLQSSAHRQTKS